MRKIGFIMALIILVAGVSVRAQKGVPQPRDSKYDVCVQDDTNGYYVLLNSESGDYYFERCSDGVEFEGIGVVSVKECELVLEHIGFNRYVAVVANLCTQNGKAVVRVFKGMKTIPFVPPMLETLSDRDMKNDTWDCSEKPPVLLRP